MGAAFRRADDNHRSFPDRFVFSQKHTERVVHKAGRFCKMIGSHTLVIPTFNRHALLKRLVQYYHKRAQPMNLLVLDSSRPEIVEENSKELSLYGAAVRHIAFPGSVASVTKILQGLAQVQTKYVSFCADDDLVFSDGLHKAIGYLEQHSDYVGAHGIYLNFRQAGRYVHIKSEYSGPSNEAHHPGARIFRLCQKYESLFYAVFRTEDLRNIFALLPSLDTSLFQELFQSVATVIKGKIKRFPSLYAARQFGPPAEPHREKWQTFHWFAENPGEVLERYRAYREIVWTFYESNAPAPRLEKEAFYKTLDLAHAVYFCSGCPPRDFYSVLQVHWPGDPYLATGPLDALRIADKLMAFKRTVYPDGDPGPDMIEQLQTPAGISKWATVGALSALRYMWLTASSFPKVARLDFDVRKVCRTAWKCRLPLRARWLTMIPGFRGTYLELCHYLDQT
jgi:glycosyltransferase domain-containing protein